MKKLILTAIIAGSLLNVSCKKDPADAPRIPPESSLDADFSDFEGTGITDTVTTGEGWYWGRSITHVVFWNVALTVNLAVPVTSFKEAINHTPKYVSKKKGWLWQYTVYHATGTYTAKLYGKKETGEVHWKMLISKDGAYEDVEWYTGVSKDDNSSGTWNLNKDPLNPKAYMSVAWSVTGVKKEIKYTLIESGNIALGSYIEYGTDPGISYNAYYNIYGAKDDYSVQIQWMRYTKNGRIKEEKFYNDGEWRCWDSAAANTTCN